MKQKISLETPITECRRAKSYIIFECALFALLFLATFFVSKSIQYISVLGLILLLAEILWFLIYFVGVRKNKISISRNFVYGHRGIVNTRDIIMPVNKIDSISLSSSFFENIFGAATITVCVPGRIGGIKFHGMNQESAVQIAAVFQKIVRADAVKPKPNAEQ